ncbi:threonine aldolase family protein [Pectobacterium aroidearum]|uniref:threonine aldolase family protein n=1 Tax=Pectobacterium aroidearum TaxID=1201031 RepID=UPI0032EEEEDE
MNKYSVNLAPLKQPIAFTSDNIAGASSEVLEALIACNTGHANPYGNDEYTHRVEQKFSALFERDVSIFLVPTGTTANSLCLATMTPPWGSVLCHPLAHINNDECGAPEFYTDGAKMHTVDGPDAKIDPIKLSIAVRNKVGDVHTVQPSVVSITQATEVGSIYTQTEIEEIGEVCRSANVRLHMDGSRLANAFVSMNCSLADMTWRAGVDALSFGATKNGVPCAEAVVLFDPKLKTELAYRRKRAGHLFSKMRFLSAQMDAYLTNDLWLRNARHANAMAKRLVDGLQHVKGVQIMGTNEANIVFCTLPVALSKALLEAGFVFYDGRWEPGVVRFVTSFATTADEVDQLIAYATALSA